MGRVRTTTNESAATLTPHNGGLSSRRGLKDWAASACLGAMMLYPTVQRAGDHLEEGERKWRDVVGRGCRRMALPDHVQGQVACSTLSFSRGKKRREEEEGKRERIAEGAGHCYGVCLPT